MIATIILLVTISLVAVQAKLLALNASIQAAQAGEAEPAGR